MSCRYRRCHQATEHYHAPDRPTVTVFFMPEERGRMVTTHACWGADNGYETAVFPTVSEAASFAKRYFGVNVPVPAEAEGA